MGENCSHENNDRNTEKIAAHLNKNSSARIRTNTDTHTTTLDNIRRVTEDESNYLKQTSKKTTVENNLKTKQQNDSKNVCSNLYNSDTKSPTLFLENKKYCECDIFGYSATGIKLSESTHPEYSRDPNSRVKEKISKQLKQFRSELSVIRETDLTILKQFIDISKTIKRVQQEISLRAINCQSVFSPTESLQNWHRPLERQFSAPHSLARRRAIYRSGRFNTEGDCGDSLSSFGENEMDLNHDLDESTSNLNLVFNSSCTKSSDNLSQTSISLDIILTFDLLKDGYESYEDVLRKNVTVWKISSLRQESLDNNVA